MPTTERLNPRLSEKARATARLERVLPAIESVAEAAALSPSPGDTSADATDKLLGAVSVAVRDVNARAVVASGVTAFQTRVEVDTCHVVGDSIAVGSAAPTAAERYANQIAAALAVDLENHGLSSANISRYSTQLLPGWTHPNSPSYASSPSSIGPGDLVVLSGDYNGLRDLGNNASYQTHHENVLRALALWASNDSTTLTLGQSSSVTKTGSWSNSSLYGGALGTQSSTNGNSLTFSFEGDSLYFVFVAYSAPSTPYSAGVSGRPDASGSVVSLSVDGTSVATGINNYSAFGNRASYNGSDANDTVKLDYAPWGLRYSGFGPGRHSAVITLTTASASKPFTLLFAAGSDDRKIESGTGPVAVIQTTFRPLVAGGVSLTTEALVTSAVSAFHTKQRKVWSELSSDGFPVLLAQTGGWYDNSTASGDNVHPNATGHTQIAQATLSALTPYGQPATNNSVGGHSVDGALTVSGNGSITGTLTLASRLLVLPTASSGGTTTRFGYGSVSASSVAISHSATTLDRELILGGNVIYSRENSTGNGANLSVGTLNYTTIVQGAMTVAQTLGVTGATTLGALTTTGATALKGSATNDSAAAGNVGELLSGTVLSASAVSLTSLVTANAASVSLTAGDWDVDGFVGFSLTSASLSSAVAGVGTTSATLGSEGSYVKQPLTTTLLTDNVHFVTPTQRISLSATTTVYLHARAQFSAGSVGAYGVIRARRVR